MLSQLINHWIGSGGVNHSLKDQSPVRICNALSFCFVLVSLFQLPVLIQFWTTAGEVFWPFYAGTLVGAALVPVVNRLGRLVIARQVLIFCYASYIISACFVWQENIGIQHFMLLGVFVCPFVFYSWEHKQALGFMFFFALFYLVLDLRFILEQPIAGNVRKLPQWLVCINSLFFTLSALSCSFFLQKNSKLGWLKLYTDQLKSNKLLAHTFPASVIAKLKSDNGPLNEHLPQVTVLFADIQGYTGLFRTLPPHEIVVLLNDLFSRFDVITKRYSLEKIKTIGDEYMAVCGAPVFNPEHAILACQCALDMQQDFEMFRSQHNLDTSIRIGLATGNVVAGVIGKDKFSYDIWGNAVNLAARMQCLCEPGNIQVSQSTAELATHKFTFSQRGKVMVKGIGNVNAYWLKETKSLCSS